MPHYYITVDLVRVVIIALIAGGVAEFWREFKKDRAKQKKDQQ